MAALYPTDAALLPDDATPGAVRDGRLVVGIEAEMGRRFVVGIIEAEKG